MVYNRHSFYNWFGIVFRHGLVRMELLRHSMQELWNRYSDARAIGGCPRVGYFSAGTARLAPDPICSSGARSSRRRRAHAVRAARIGRGRKENPRSVMHALFGRFGMLLDCVFERGRLSDEEKQRDFAAASTLIGDAGAQCVDANAKTLWEAGGPRRTETHVNALHGPRLSPPGAHRNCASLSTVAASSSRSRDDASVSIEDKRTARSRREFIGSGAGIDQRARAGSNGVHSETAIPDRSGLIAAAPRRLANPPRGARAGFSINTVLSPAMLWSAPR